MAHYHIWSKDDVSSESYWVSAPSPKEARRLVALNVADAAKAEDVERFECHPSTEKKPLAEFIHRRLYGPVPIVRR